ncbi:MAG TPA: fluoride efflux transporter CrcB [Solirubrobacteraceae bacterium]|jgi:CrcB protein
MSAPVWIAVALVGGLGASARFLLHRLTARRIGRTFPFATFAINISGSLVLGLLIGLAVTGDLLLIAGTATIGSYTTFSTWMLETQRLAEDGKLRDATLNIVASLVLGVAAAALGRAIGARL